MTEIQMQPFFLIFFHESKPNYKRDIGQSIRGNHCQMLCSHICSLIDWVIYDVHRIYRNHQGLDQNK
jgi:hypothetical protein